MVYFRFPLIDRVIFLGVDVSDPTCVHSWGTGRLWEYRATTLRQWRTQVRFEIPAEIPFAHELVMKMLQENVKIKKIYWGNLLLVYIYTKN